VGLRSPIRDQKNSEETVGNSIKEATLVEFGGGSEEHPKAERTEQGFRNASKRGKKGTIWGVTLKKNQRVHHKIEEKGHVFRGRKVIV